MAALLWFQFDRAEQAFARTRAEHAKSAQQTVGEHRAAIEKLQKDHDEREAWWDAKHREFLSDAKISSGEAAQARHAQEWKRRQDHDPALAVTAMERTLLEVERLGKDPAMTAEAALQKVAELVTPAGSRIEVKPGDNGFVVRVAFRLSAVRPYEAGAGSRHTSTAELRKEVEEVTARVIQDLFEYSGGRGIHRLSVSCNRALVVGKDETERLVMRSLYRAVIEADDSARVASWGNLSPGQVAEIMKIDHDVISGLMMVSVVNRGLRLDPNEPLEF